MKKNVLVYLHFYKTKMEYSPFVLILLIQCIGTAIEIKARFKE